MDLLGYLDALGYWMFANLQRMLYSVAAVVVGYVAYKIVSRQITRLKDQKKLEPSVAYTLNRMGKWLVTVAVLSSILAEFGITIGTISGLLTLLGGTIIGFAAINTIGNTIAGLIVMTNRPFKIGDRIFFNGQFADVVGIDLIYTKMTTLDNVLVSVPNQELLKQEVQNFGRERTIRRHVAVTPGFECDSHDVEEALLEAAANVSGILKDPKPYVWITKFHDYAVEYTLYVFMRSIGQMPEIEAELHRSILESCKNHQIDISTPLLLRKIQN